jgi:hypothetical protein
MLIDEGAYKISSLMKMQELTQKEFCNNLVSTSSASWNLEKLLVTKEIFTSLINNSNIWD